MAAAVSPGMKNCVEAVEASTLGAEGVIVGSGTAVGAVTGWLMTGSVMTGSPMTATGRLSLTWGVASALTTGETCVPPVPAGPSVSVAPATALFSPSLFPSSVLPATSPPPRPRPISSSSSSCIGLTSL